MGRNRETQPQMGKNLTFVNYPVNDENIFIGMFVVSLRCGKIGYFSGTLN